MLFSSVTGGKNCENFLTQIFFDSIAQDIYYIKQTQSCAIFAATQFWNSAGHLQHKTNPNPSYFELSYVFWEHNDSVGWGTTVLFGQKYPKTAIVKWDEKTKVYHVRDVDADYVLHVN